MKVYVDQNECISCALCVDQCPAVFGFNSDNKSHVEHEDAVKEHSEQVKISAYECPTSAIKIM
ncbi:MAG: ferredoxin [bacterium]|nr:ferredoxin [bacterium]